MKKIESGSLAVMLDEETLGLRIEKDGVVWNTDPKKTPELIFAEGTYRFLDAEEISHEVYSFGVGCGIRSRYAGFAGTPYAFETIIWIEAVDETFWMEWIPLCDEGLHPVCLLPWLSFWSKPDTCNSASRYQRALLSGIIIFFSGRQEP